METGTRGRYRASTPDQVTAPIGAPRSYASAAPLSRSTPTTIAGTLGFPVLLSGLHRIAVPLARQRRAARGEPAAVVAGRHPRSAGRAYALLRRVLDSAVRGALLAAARVVS